MVAQFFLSRGLQSLLQRQKAPKPRCKVHLTSFDANGSGLGSTNPKETLHPCTAVSVSASAKLLEAAESKDAYTDSDTCEGSDNCNDNDSFFSDEDPSDSDSSVFGATPFGPPKLQRQVGAHKPKSEDPGQEKGPGPAPGPSHRSITVAVHSLSGSIVGHFGGFLPGNLIADLQRGLAEATGKATVVFQLLKGAALLDGKSTFADAGVMDGAELTICFLSASALIRAAQEALDACPEREPEDFDVQFITIANSGFRLAPPNSQAYRDWCAEEGPRVTKILQALCKTDKEVMEGRKEEAARLALRCLWLPPPPHDRVLPDMVAVGPVNELYPDELTLAALQLLPLCTQAEDRAVARVLRLWLSRARLSGINPSFQTMARVLELLPDMVTTSSQQKDMVAFLDWAVCDLLNVDSSGRPRSERRDVEHWEAFYGHLEPADIWWWIQSCYQAMLQLLRGTSKAPKAPRFFYAWPALNLDIHKLVNLSRECGVSFKDEERVLLLR